MPRPFIPAENCASVELIYAQAGDVSENVFHVHKGSPFTLPQLQALRAVANTWDASYGSSGRTTVATLSRIRTKALDTSSSATEDYSLPIPRPGTLGGAPLPLNVSFCVKLSTGLAGRSYRGRWYFANLPPGILSDAGHISSGSAAGYVGLLTQLIASLTAAGYTMVVLSYRADKAWRTAAVATPIITAVNTDLNLDSQRRRLPGRGHTL